MLYCLVFEAMFGWIEVESVSKIELKSIQMLSNLPTIYHICQLMRVFHNCWVFTTPLRKEWTLVSDELREAEYDSLLARCPAPDPLCSIIPIPHVKSVKHADQDLDRIRINAYYESQPKMNIKIHLISNILPNTNIKLG